MLKISEKLENLNKNIEKLENKKNWYRVELHENYNILKISKNALKILNENKINLHKNYLNSTKEKMVYNSIYAILNENKDVFTDITE